MRAPRLSPHYALVHKSKPDEALTLAGERLVGPRWSVLKAFERLTEWGDSERWRRGFLTVPVGETRQAA